MIGSGQVFRIFWENMEPFMQVRINGNTKDIKTIKLFDNTELSWKIGKKYCTGYWKNGYRPCPKNAEISRGSKCQICMQLDEYFRCVKCDGSVCLNTNARRQCMSDEFFLYLVSFNSLLKVGISRTFRLKTRLVEQGADFGAKLMKIKDGKKARKIEQEVSKKLGIVDRVNGSEKFEHLFGDPNKSLKKITRCVEKLKAFGYVISPEIYDLRRYYKLDKVREVPVLLKNLEGKQIHGKVIAIKGNIMILRDKNKYIALNTHDLIGRKVEEL
ncbi:MAG: hypothetical protein DRO96_00010 [Candidatus Aenigmatarchaeota archaeon]|nr:MAG: hypothetical protein DRO96_00010 [Candidatus Aenigmarchaeota archaeon]